MFPMWKEKKFCMRKIEGTVRGKQIPILDLLEINVGVGYLGLFWQGLLTKTLV